jgi:tetratricopeptide (TPR) repeat protein
VSDFRAGCGFFKNEDLEAAIAGTLPAARRADLDRHVAGGCAECALLAADLAVFAGVVSGGALEGERQEADRQAEMLRVRLQREVERKRAAVPVRRTGRGLRWGLLAAALVVLALFVWQMRGPAAPQGLRIALPSGEAFIASVKTFDLPPALRGERDLEQVWRQARDAYDRGRYAKAEPLLGRIASEDPAAFDARLYRGICLLALGRLPEARSAFAEARSLARAQDLSTTSLAWYEALAALQAGDVAAARVALEEAASGSGEEADQARELLTRLR